MGGKEKKLIRHIPPAFLYKPFNTHVLITDAYRYRVTYAKRAPICTLSEKSVVAGQLTRIMLRSGLVIVLSLFVPSAFRHEKQSTILAERERRMGGGRVRQVVQSDKLRSGQQSLPWK